MRDRIQDDLGRVADLFGQLADDARHNLLGVSETIGHRLNLVSREEFDQQRARVDQLRQQLDLLQQQLDRLENKSPPD